MPICGCIWNRMMRKIRTKRFAELHGGNLLEEMISTCNGYDIPVTIRFYSAQQVHKAINNYYRRPQVPRYFRNRLGDEWKMGILDDTLVLIKEYTYADQLAEAYRNIVVTSMMCGCNNVLKLLGCCLERSIPALIYYGNNNLIDASPGRINDFGPLGLLMWQGYLCEIGFLTWKQRLKIAKEVADTVTHLHTAFPRPIIHMGISPQNIFLDADGFAKLCDFSLCILIPQGESHVKKDYVEDSAFTDPFYLRTSVVTDKTDVYSVGMLLLVFLTGKRAIDLLYLEPRRNLAGYVKYLVEKDRFNEVIDPKMWRDVAESEVEQHLQLQLKACLDLALRCINSKPDDRPPMIDVAKKLLSIEIFDDAPSHHPN